MIADQYEHEHDRCAEDHAHDERQQRIQSENEHSPHRENNLRLHETEQQACTSRHDERRRNTLSAKRIIVGAVGVGEWPAARGLWLGRRGRFWCCGCLTSF